ncbi:MAG: Adenylate cyclase [Devosia sp.]|uniref:winged helix-turn-helix domain-containing protein n=1 Tax=Devosia sp. TaxID=1871048 RepID=UPI002636C7C9|nr:winged helix-turn-helix domain-containing protein [Devosia sp.]MDB5542327.1 Adenylate cyclase [Devosia sp.]
MTENAPQRFGPFTFDRQRMVVSKNGAAVPLGGRSAVLLGALLDARGQVVEKDALIGAVWPDVIVEDGNLAVQITALRKALGTKADGTEWIVTVRNLGYRLIAGESTGSEAGGAAVRPAIAVLPFANLSSDPEQEFVADGVVEDLITALSRFHTFAVVSRSSSFVYKGRAVDAREAARDLGVRYLLEGSVRRSGDRIRVSAQLIEGATGEHLWAERFDGAATDMFDFQDTITDTVIGLIEPQIRKAEIDRARSKRPETLDAWDLYVQALPLVNSGAVPNYVRALELLDRAVALDPTYAPALALAAWAHEKRHLFGGPSLPDYESDVEVAIELAERAAAADPDDALALVLFGWLRLFYKRDFSGLDLVKRAVALNPNNSSVLDLSGAAAWFVGDIDEMIACSTRGLQLSPGAPIRYVFLCGMAVAHNLAGRYEEAVDFGKRTVELEPDYINGHLHLAIAYAQLGRIEEARRHAAEVLRIHPDFKIEGSTERAPKRLSRGIYAPILIEGMRKAGLSE